MFKHVFSGEDDYTPTLNGTAVHAQQQQHQQSQHSNNNNSNSTLPLTVVPSSLSAQQICQTPPGTHIGSGGNNNSVNNSSVSNNSINSVSHSQSAHEIGQVPLTPLAQHQQALHQQLQMRFANNSNNCNSG